MFIRYSLSNEQYDHIVSCIFINSLRDMGPEYASGSNEETIRSAFTSHCFCMLILFHFFTGGIYSTSFFRTHHHRLLHLLLLLLPPALRPHYLAMAFPVFYPPITTMPCYCTPFSRLGSLAALSRISSSHLLLSFTVGPLSPKFPSRIRRGTLVSNTLTLAHCKLVKGMEGTGSVSLCSLYSSSSTVFTRRLKKHFLVILYR